MNRIMFFQIIIVAFSINFGFSQTMDIHTNNGQVHQFEIGEIDSITFTVTGSSFLNNDDFTSDLSSWTTDISGSDKILWNTVWGTSVRITTTGCSSSRIYQNSIRNLKVGELIALKWREVEGCDGCGGRRFYINNIEVGYKEGYYKEGNDYLKHRDDLSTEETIVLSNGGDDIKSTHVFEVIKEIPANFEFKFQGESCPGSCEVFVDYIKPFVQ